MKEVEPPIVTKLKARQGKLTTVGVLKRNKLIFGVPYTDGVFWFGFIWIYQKMDYYTNDIYLDAEILHKLEESKTVNLTIDFAKEILLFSFNKSQSVYNKQAIKYGDNAILEDLEDEEINQMAVPLLEQLKKHLNK